ncbi:MAG: hypothetical protein H7Z38_08480 [Rubrivivax sp.]|nr:hypothetical protein [Pyrinomonadaceae bacterium]
MLNIAGAFFVWAGSEFLLYALPRAVVTLYLTSGTPSSAAKDLTILAATAPANLLSLGLVWLYVTRAGRLPFRGTLGLDCGSLRKGLE